LLKVVDYKKFHKSIFVNNSNKTSKRKNLEKSVSKYVKTNHNKKVCVKTKNKFEKLNKTPPNVELNMHSWHGSVLIFHENVNILFRHLKLL